MESFLELYADMYEKGQKTGSTKNAVLLKPIKFFSSNFEMTILKSVLCQNIKT